MRESHPRKSRMPILSSYSRSFLWQQGYDLVWQLRSLKIRIDQMAMCAAMTGSSKVGGLGGKSWGQRLDFKHVVTGRFAYIKTEWFPKWKMKSLVGKDILLVDFPRWCISNSFMKRVNFVVLGILLKATKHWWLQLPLRWVVNTRGLAFRMTKNGPRNRFKNWGVAKRITDLVMCLVFFNHTCVGFIILS